MKKGVIDSFSISLTDVCNLECSYCYQRKKNLCHSLDRDSLFNSLDAVFPYLGTDAYIVFYGGEPLLRFDLMRQGVEHAEKLAQKTTKPIHFSLTTNGTLIDDVALRFLNDHGFFITLSIDDLQDKGQGGLRATKPMKTLIEKIVDQPKLRLATHSVFTCTTVGHLARTMEGIVRTGVNEATFSLSCTDHWNDTSLARFEAELEKLVLFLLHWKAMTGKVPLPAFSRQRKNVFACTAGKNRLALAADNTWWGCILFADWFRRKRKGDEYKQYCLGTLDLSPGKMARMLETAAIRYADLRQDHFHTDERLCCDCALMTECRTCPMASIMAGSVLVGGIAASMCRNQQVLAAAIRSFQARALQKWKKTL